MSLSMNSLSVQYRYAILEDSEIIPRIYGHNENSKIWQKSENMQKF